MPPIIMCKACRFWLSANDQNGHCKRRAPRPTESPDQIAHWPETFAGDSCGEGAERDTAFQISMCMDCVFWCRAINNEGVYPIDRLGARAGWWREAGHCKRYAPGPSSTSGQRGFWRVTHSKDGCAEGISTY